METESGFTPLLVKRFVREFQDSDPTRLAESVLIENYFSSRVFVLLGDPGAGKTTLFEQAASDEGALFLSVRSFLRDPVDLAEGQALYLDGLDEIRARQEDGFGVLDSMISKLHELGKPKFRLSCRATDWYAGVDQSELQGLLEDESLKVLNLEPLSTKDQREIIERHGYDPDKFLRRAEDEGIEDWLVNPQNLLLLLAAVKDRWPESRSRLFENACKVLLGEANQTHGRTRFGRVPDSQLLLAAERIFAVQLLSGRAGFALQPSHDEDFPGLQEVVEEETSQQACEAVVRRRLFRHEGPERVVPVHRTIAEYLAARYLARKVLEGLPMTRVLALTTVLGGVHSELRGMFGWFASMIGRTNLQVLGTDPLSILLHGDLAELGPSKRQEWLGKLATAARDAPFLMNEVWVKHSLDALVTPSLELVLLEILADPESVPAVVELVLKAVAAKKPSSDFSELLLKILRDSNRWGRVRQEAGRAFCLSYADRVDDLRALLDEVQSGKLADSLDRLRGHLLRALFPKHLGYIEVLAYLLPSSPAKLNSYVFRYLRRDVFESVPDSELPEFLDALVAWDRVAIRGHVALTTLFSSALMRGVLRCSHRVTAERLYRWLGLHIPYGSASGSVLDPEDRELIADWLEQRPDLLKALLGVRLGQEDQVGGYQLLKEFQKRCAGAALPSGIGYFLLQQIPERPPAGVALLECVVRLAGEREGEPSLDEILQAVEANSEVLSSAWDKLRLCPLPEQDASEEEFEATRLAQREKNITEIRKHLVAVGSGRDWYLLEWLLQRGRLQHLSGETETSVFSTLAQEFCEVIGHLTLEGCVASIWNTNQPSIQELGDLAASGKESHSSLVVCQGMEVLWEISVWSSVSIELRVRALINALTSAYVDEHADWVEETVRTFPQEVASALEVFWRPALSSSKARLKGSTMLKEHPELARLLCPKLLKKYSRCHFYVLEDLLQLALHLDLESEVLPIAARELENPRGLKAEQFMLWLTAAFLCCPSNFRSKLKKHAPRVLRSGSTEKKANILFDFCKAWFESEKDATWRLARVLDLLDALARAYPKVPHRPDGVYRGPQYELEVSDFISGQINWLGSRTEKEAVDALVKLRELPSMRSRRDSIQQVISLQLRKRRDAEFQQPSLEQVIETLAGGRPANQADFFAFVVEHLETLSEDLRHGPTDGYQLFWNSDSHGRVTKPLSEDVCRDRLMERLRDRLAAFDIEVDVTREADHAGRKRSDLRFWYQGRAIPVEIKLPSHTKIWSAIEDQLIPRYSTAPDSAGYGIYLVFWFGDALKLGRQPPDGLAAPTSADEMKSPLEQQVPEDHRDKIAVICFDVSRPQN